MLASIEHQQQALVLQSGDQAGKRILVTYSEAKNGCNGAWRKAGVAERGQIDKPYAVFIARDQPLGHSQRQRGLTDAAGSDNRDKTLARQPGCPANSSGR